MAKHKDFRPNVGDTVWVIERDEDGVPCEVSGYVFIAESIGFGIVSPTLNGASDPKALLRDQVEQTREDYHGDLAVYPMEDMYASQAEADKAFASKEVDSGTENE